MSKNKKNGKTTSFFKKARLFVLSNLAWIFIMLSLVFFVLHLSGCFVLKAESLFKDVAISLLTSGVFAAILKSLQFTGLFREEIEKVMLDTEFITNRKDLRKVWRIVSKSIYKHNFPEISQKFEDKILEYLDPDHEFYYKDYVVTIKIEEITDNFDIIYTQTAKYTVVINDDNIKDGVRLMLRSVFTSEGSTKVQNDLEVFKVNEKDEEMVEDQETVGNPNFSKYFIPLSGDKEHKIHTRFRRKYSLIGENYKLYRVLRLTKNMDVIINYPDNVKVSFFNIGLSRTFKHEHVEIPNQICRSFRNDILLPYQGFGMSFERYELSALEQKKDQLIT